MQNLPILPKDNEQLALTVDAHACRQSRLMTGQYVMWRLAHLYLSGYRTFTTFDTRAGRIVASPYVLSKDGKREYQSQELAKAISDTSSHLASMNAMPKVGRKSDDLANIRERAIAQTVLDSVTNQTMLEKKIDQFSYLLTALGFCGIQGDVSNHPSLGLTVEPQIVHPRELLPWPALGDDYTQEQGRLRQQMITIESLKDIFGSKLGGAKALDKMEWYRAESGQVLADPLAYSESDTAYDAHGSANPYNQTEVAKTDYARVRQLWTFGENETVQEYVVCSGRHVLHRESFRGDEVYCPVQVARFMENGTWYGQGLFATLFSIHREMEDLLHRMFQNVRDQDQHATLIVPGTQIPEKPTMYNVGDKYRVIGVQVDPMEQGFNPFSLPVNNAGDMPGRTAAYAKQMMDSLNPVDDLIRDKGRIDSAEAMEILQEEAKKKHSTPMRAIDRSLGAYHRTVLAGTLRELMKGNTELKVTRLDPDLAGVSLSEDGTTITLDGERNPIPSLSHLTYGVQDASPTNNANQKRGAMQMFQLTGDLEGLILHSLREGFKLDLYMDEARAAYESVVRDILLIYNDGQTPHQVVLTPTVARPKLQLRVLAAFTASVTYRLASPQVQNEFQKYITTMKTYLGTVLSGPPGSPDDFAAVAAAREQQQGAPR